MVKIFQTWSLADAQYRACIVNNRSQADLCVFLVSNQGMATGNGLWFVEGQRAQANRRVMFCDRGRAEFTVCFVKNPGLAGWQQPHKFSSLF